MENINIAELLENCPKGMELDCTMFDNVTLEYVAESSLYPIRVRREDGNCIALTKYGQFINADFAKCVIFPKGKTTWKGFVPPCKFKVGDTVRGKYTNNIYTISCITPTEYNLTNGKSFTFDDEDCYELVPHKFDINTLVPFESRVLVRSVDGDLWKPAIYGFSHSKGCYVVGGVYWAQCIPYEGNEHLRGKTNSCDAFYKT